MKPFERNGIRFGFDGEGNRVALGACMGRRDIIPRDKQTVQKLHLQHVPLYDGAYDKGGAYWGCGKRLYCAWGESETEQCQLFMRADSRDAAKIAALLVFPNAKFFN